VKLRWLALILLIFLLLAACGQKGLEEPVTLINHEEKEVTFPQEKPVLFFFLTTYTWGLCQQQLVELHKNLNELEELAIPMYIVSKDTPGELGILHEAMVEELGTSLPLLSDPEFQLIEQMNMRNGDVAYRGYALMDEKGNLVFKTVNDHYGEEIDETIKEIKEEYLKLQEK
jgi:peroxiredoxin